MKEKLNLTIEKKIKERAKTIADQKGISVSKMVEELLESIPDEPADWKPEDESVVSKMSGSVPIPSTIDYEEILTSELLDKKGYGKNSD